MSHIAQKLGALGVSLAVVASVVAPTAAAQAATIDLDAQIRKVNFVSISHLTVDTPAVGDSTSSITVSLPDEVTIDYDLSETYWAITNLYSFVVSPTPVTNVVGADVVLPITPGALFNSAVDPIPAGDGYPDSYQLVLTNFTYSVPVHANSIKPDDGRLHVVVPIALDDSVISTNTTYSVTKPDISSPDTFFKTYEISVAGESPVHLSGGETIRLHAPGFNWEDGPDEFFGTSAESLQDAGIYDHSFDKVVSTHGAAFDGTVLQFTVGSVSPEAMNTEDLAFSGSYRNAKSGPFSRVEISFPVTFGEPAPGASWATTSAPTMSKPKVGSPTVVDVGAWSPEPTDFGFQWRLNGVPVAGAVGDSYTPIGADLGQMLSVEVTATRAGYETVTVESKPAKIAAGTISSTVPTLTGGTLVGDTLTASLGVWDPVPALSFTWLRNGKTIAGATSYAYTLVPADRGKTIQVRVTGQATGFTTVSKTSVKTKKIGYGTFTGGAVAIDGTPQVGQSLTASVSGISPAPTKLAYQWYVNGKAVSKAKKAQFTIPANALFGHITVMVTASAPGYTAKKLTLSPGVLNPGPADPEPYTVSASGVSQVGKTVKASVTGPKSGATIRYQWMLNGNPIPGATKSSYKAPASAAGLSLGVAVSVTKPGTTAFYTQHVVGPVLLGYKTATPKITYSGTLKTGTVLSAVTGMWSPTPTESFSYTWYRGSALVGTGETYTVQANDKGKKLKVVVSVPEGHGYAAASATSKATAKVK